MAHHNGHSAIGASGREGGIVVVVTGASSGLGQAAARRLAREPGARVLLVARRADRLEALADELGPGVHTVAVDLTDDDAPARVRAAVESIAGGRLDVLVNNAGGSWRKTFAEGGWDNVSRTMRLNFDAQVRLTEALLDPLRASAPSAIVNVSSTAARVARERTGAYSASKAALAAWSDALYLEERVNGVHVGNVLPGFIPTEGFPQQELVDRAVTRWLLGTPEQVAEAIAEVALRRVPERYVPRKYEIAAVLRALVPGLVRRAIGGGVARAMTTRTALDDRELAGRSG